MKKLLRLLSLVLAIACSLAFVGCGGTSGGNSSGSGNGGGSESSVDGKAAYTVDFDLPATTEATIKIGIPDNDPEKKKINAIITEFNKKYPRKQPVVNLGKQECEARPGPSAEIVLPFLRKPSYHRCLVR